MTENSTPNPPYRKWEGPYLRGPGRYTLEPAFTPALDAEEPDTSLGPITIYEITPDLVQRIPLLEPLLGSTVVLYEDDFGFVYTFLPYPHYVDTLIEQLSEDNEGENS